MRARATPYALGLMLGPSVGLTSMAAFSRTHDFSSGDAITLSSLTWFGAMQGHLWEATRDQHDDAGVNAAFGTLGSLGGFLIGVAVSHNRNMSEGHAASLGAGNWWGMSLGYLSARQMEDGTLPSLTKQGSTYSPSYRPVRGSAVRSTERPASLWASEQHRPVVVPTRPTSIVTTATVHRSHCPADNRYSRMYVETSCGFSLERVT